MAEMYNAIVGDKGKTSVRIGTFWYDESRKAVISGFISLDALKKALADGTVSKLPGSDKSRDFKGHDTVGLAFFKAGKRAVEDSGGNSGL